MSSQPLPPTTSHGMFPRVRTKITNRQGWSRAFFRFGLALAIYAGLSITGGRGDDWPAFLGPEGNNSSRETGLLDKWPAYGPPLLWEKEIGSGYSAPSVRDHYLVFISNIINDLLDLAEGVVHGAQAALMVAC